VAGVTEPGPPALPEDLGEVIRHLESAWPHEGCGVLLRAGGEGPWRCRPLRNALGAPAARTAYAFEPREWLGVLCEAEVRGEQVMCVFHSHVETGTDFSEEDRRQAAPGGEPLLPGVSYLVMGVWAGRVRRAEVFTWEGTGYRGHRVRRGLADGQPMEIP
jgi:[CysO sulfur-carrier protein]-S-L-cysteine hydrolase